MTHRPRTQAPFSLGRPRTTLPPLALLLFLILCGITGCTAHQGTLLPADTSRPGNTATIAALPFFPQEDYQCGPASMAGVLRHMGVDTTPEQIAAAIYRNNLHGTLSLDLALYPRTIGLHSRFYEGSITDIVAAVDAGIPLIVMADSGFGPVSTYHFMVVAGYTPQGIIVNSYRTERQRMGWDAFMRVWNRTGRWTLRVSATPLPAPATPSAPTPLPMPAAPPAVTP